MAVDDHEKDKMTKKKSVKQPHLNEPEEHKHRYPRRQTSAPVRYGTDEYVDTALHCNDKPEDPKSIMKSKLSEKWRGS